MNNLMFDLWMFADAVLSSVGDLSKEVFRYANLTLSDVLGEGFVSLLNFLFETTPWLNVIYPEGYLELYLETSIVSIIFGGAVTFLFGLTLFKWVWKAIEMIPIV